MTIFHCWLFVTIHDCKTKATDLHNLDKCVPAPELLAQLLVPKYGNHLTQFQFLF